MEHAPINPTPVDHAPLCCSACGYNLTGICTVHTPAGKCPECGAYFARSVLKNRQLARDSFNTSGVVVKMFAFPAVIAFTPLCCLLSGVPFSAFALPVLGCVIAGWVLAREYHYGTTAGVPADQRKWFQKLFVLPWLLFSLMEFFLTAIYLTAIYLMGGCSLIGGLF